MIFAPLVPLAVSAPALTFLGVVVVAFATLGSAAATSLVTRRASARSADLEERRVSLSEFEAHKDFMSGQIRDLKDELETEREARKAAEKSAGEAKTTARRLGLRVTQLEAAMTANGMTLPPQPASA